MLVFAFPPCSCRAGVGLSCVQGAAMALAKQIIVVDMNASKFELAKKFGATDFINPKDLPQGKTVVQVPLFCLCCCQSHLVAENY